ncbi:hypothetical protein [Stenotrophomonas sp. UBA7606]|uniref:hypothetical protein n=1 Tax=Stenotrophomonas sp. UBA7606 TaxID=1947559 RepID=UPI0025E67203|nr:hypothetical protein [Stenotrophomonas sp. UBA7606]
MESEVQLNEQGDVQRVYDENNRDVLFCRRAEIFFTPNEDGSPSTEGKVLWHTQWWHYIGNVKRAESLGPVIENSIAQVLGDSYYVGAAEPLPAAVIVAGIKAAYTHRAAAHFGIETGGDSEG